MASIRVVDKKRWARITCGAVLFLVLANLGALVWNGTMATMLKYTVAQPCPAGASSPDCVATVPSKVTMAWPDYGEGIPYETHLRLSTPTYGDTLEFLSLDDAERLDLIDGADDVVVTLFDEQVIQVTGANGETAMTLYTLWSLMAAIEFAIQILLAVGVVALAARLWRRSRPWLPPAMAAAAVGAVVGALAGIITTEMVTRAWTIPIIYGGYVLAGGLMALRSARVLREPFRSVTGQSGTTSAAGRQDR